MPSITRRVAFVLIGLVLAVPAAAQPAKPTAMENPFAGAPNRSQVAEAKRLVKQGKELQAANVRRRGAEKTSNVQALPELVPRYVKAAPPGWAVNEQGFIYDIVRPDGAQVCSALDKLREGESFFCSAEDQGKRHRLVVPF